MRHSVGSSEVSRDSPSSSNEEEDVTRALPLRLLARNGVAATAFPDALLRVEGMGTKGTHFRDRAKPEGGRRKDAVGHLCQHHRPPQGKRRFGRTQLISIEWIIEYTHSTIAISVK